MLPKNIYLIDNDYLVQKNVLRILTSRNLKFEVFSSVSSFLQCIDYDAVPNSSCILTEISLPELSGLDLLDILASDDMAIATILMSRHIDVPIAVEAMYGGAGYILEKPFEEADLVKALQRVISRPPVVARTHSLVEKRIGTLSPRQRQMLVNIFEGKTNREIAQDLGLSVKTVELHRSSMMQKMQVHSLTELIKVAAQHSHAIYGV